MKIVVDRAIPFIEGVFEPYAEVVYREGKDIGRDLLLDADALVIRTRTRCNRELLEGTSVRIIATATIGTDHIDEPWCRSRGIRVCNAAGCNAGGVMNYVFSALYGVASRKAVSLNHPTMGIIGVGNVGSRVQHMAEHLGFDVLLCDPPRAAAEGPEAFCSLDYLLHNSNIVTLHVPLNENTRGMVNASFFSRMRPGAFFINAARGELVNDDDLVAAIPQLGGVIIDTWNNEPYVNPILMEKVDIATPHIAGYSYQGKLNGTSAAVQAVARFLGIDALKDFYPVAEREDLLAQKLDLRGMNQGQITSVLQYNYPIFTDDFLFRMTPGSFERIRTDYRYRKEFYV